MFQTRHAVLPQTSHDEFAREEFTGSLRRFFTETLWPGTRDVYVATQRPAFERVHGRRPESVREVREAIEGSFFYRAASLLGRAAQEQLWDTVGETIERQLPALVEAARPKPDAVGTLTLNPTLAMPRYYDSVDIHVMPGNFHTELGADDVYAGALYDRGVFYFSYGGMGADNDKLGTTMTDYFEGAFPDIKPKRILDMGCGPGLSTLPWKTTYPDADVYGLDLAAPQLRYAHARAESFGKAVHFVQGDATAAPFPDGYFDVVSFCLLTHECPLPLVLEIMKEAHRLLAPGGIALADAGAPPADGVEDEFFTTWFNHNANEPFGQGLRKLDLQEGFVAAGFDPGDYFSSGSREAVYLTGMGADRAKQDGKGKFAGYVGAIRR